MPAQEQVLEETFIYLIFSAITSHCRLVGLSMVHLLPAQNVTLQSSAIYFLLHQQELPVAKCFPWESEKHQPQLSP